MLCFQNINTLNRNCKIQTYFRCINCSVCFVRFYIEQLWFLQFWRSCWEEVVSN